MATGSDLTIEAGKGHSSTMVVVIEGSIVGPSSGTPVDISITLLVLERLPLMILVIQILRD